MFAWVDLFWLAGGIALGVYFKDKIMTFIHGAEAYAAKLEATAAALKAKFTTVKATVTTDVNAVKTAATTVEKAV